jgi:hypothetical protein
MQQTDRHPAYVRLPESGELAHRAKALYSFFEVAISARDGAESTG